MSLAKGWQHPYQSRAHLSEPSLAASLGKGRQRIGRGTPVSRATFGANGTVCLLRGEHEPREEAAPLQDGGNVLVYEP